MQSARELARQAAGKPVSYAAAAFIVVIWIAVLCFAARWMIGFARN
jgi:hypothetical protein